MDKLGKMVHREKIPFSVHRTIIFDIEKTQNKIL